MNILLNFTEYFVGLFKYFNFAKENLRLDGI